MALSYQNRSSWIVRKTQANLTLCVAAMRRRFIATVATAGARKLNLRDQGGRASVARQGKKTEPGAAANVCRGGPIAALPTLATAPGA